MRFMTPAAVVVLGLIAAAPSHSATISIQPVPTNVNFGQTFSVNVVMSGVADLFAYQFDLGFDPSVVAATGITEGAFLSSGGATFFLSGVVDNIGGTISNTADSLVGPVSGVSGSGVVATASFTAVGPGATSINLLSMSLLDSTLSDISATVQNGDVTVSAVPEPSTELLCVAGVALLLAVRRYRCTPGTGRR